MTIFLLCLLLQETPVQDSSTPTTGETTTQEKVFTPITEGNVVNVGSFTLTVPPGALYASEDDAPAMFKLAKAAYIPNCAGIFFSKNDDWSFCGVVQYFPVQPFSWDPELPAEYFEGAFQRRHLYNLSLIAGTGQVILPPTLDKDQGTFSMGMHYAEEEGNSKGVFIKQMWVNAQEGVLLSIRADSFESYQNNEEMITAMMDSITPGEMAPESLDAKPTSYLRLLGINPEKKNAEASEGIPTPVLVGSVLLLVFGIGLLVFSVRKMKEQAANAEEAGSGSETSSTPENEA